MLLRGRLTMVGQRALDVAVLFAMVLQRSGGRRMSEGPNGDKIGARRSDRSALELPVPTGEPTAELS